MAKKIKISKKSNFKEFDLRNMCTPATIYFMISVIGLVLVAITNSDSEELCIGDYNCYVGNNSIIFILNAVYILFWTFILDLMCKSGYSSLSWFVLLLPFVILFILFTQIMVEGNRNGKPNKRPKPPKTTKTPKPPKTTKTPKMTKPPKMIKPSKNKGTSTMSPLTTMTPLTTMAPLTTMTPYE